MKKMIAYVVLLCFTTVFLSSNVSALLALECNCNTDKPECCCGVDCACPPEADCGCNRECTCEELPCPVCEAIVKPQPQITVQESPLVIKVCFSSPISINAEFVCFSNIALTNIRMNN